jgi:hypothetical protein
MDIKFDKYDQLKGGSSNIPLNSKYCATITELPMEHRNMIFMLIYHHSLKTMAKPHDLPYKSKIGLNGKGLNFNTSTLPLDLQYIIVRYLDEITN